MSDYAKEKIDEAIRQIQEIDKDWITNPNFNSTSVIYTKKEEIADEH